MYTVVVVDDEYWTLQGILKTFDWAKHGFEVAHATCDAGDAWRHIQSHAPDAVLTDIRMPVITGLQLAEKMRDAGIESEIIFLSGYAEFEYARSALTLNAFDYLLKPLDARAADRMLERLSRKLSGGAGSAEDEMAEISMPDEKSLAQTNPQFMQLLSHIHKSYGGQLHITKLSKQFFINTSYCCKLFDVNFGQTFSEYVADIRMKNAKRLLLSGQPVKSVAAQVGYTDYYYFMKAYKKYYGITPTEQQKQGEVGL